MRNLLLAALAAGTMLGGAANAATTYTSLASWQADAGTYTNDTTYGTPFTSISSITLDDGTGLTFSNSVNVRKIGTGWATWSGGYTGDVLFNSTNSLTISFDTAVTGFGLFAESNPFGLHRFDLLMSDGSSVNGLFDGDGGAGFLGFLGAGIVSATISSDVDFAVGDFYVTTKAPVPEPATWAMMIGGMGLVGAAMRRRRTAVSFA